MSFCSKIRQKRKEFHFQLFYFMFYFLKYGSTFSIKIKKDNQKGKKKENQISFNTHPLLSLFLSLHHHDLQHLLLQLPIFLLHNQPSPAQHFFATTNPHLLVPFPTSNSKTNPLSVNGETHCTIQLLFINPSQQNHVKIHSIQRRGEANRGANKNSIHKAFHTTK